MATTAHSSKAVVGSLVIAALAAVLACSAVKRDCGDRADDAACLAAFATEHGRELDEAMRFYARTDHRAFSNDPLVLQQLAPTVVADAEGHLRRALADGEMPHCIADRWPISITIETADGGMGGYFFERGRPATRLYPEGGDVRLFVRSRPRGARVCGKVAVYDNPRSQYLRMAVQLAGAEHAELHFSFKIR